MEKQFKIFKKFLKESEIGYTMEHFDGIFIRENKILAIFKDDFQMIWNINPDFIFKNKDKEAYYFLDSIIEFTWIQPKINQYN